MNMRIVDLLVGVLGKLGLEFSYLLLQVDDIGAVDPLPFGAIVVLARRA